MAGTESWFKSQGLGINLLTWREKINLDLNFMPFSKGLSCLYADVDSMIRASCVCHLQLAKLIQASNPVNLRTRGLAMTEA